MARCADCEKLVEAKSEVAPHPGLKYLGTDDGFAGHKFAIQRYRCTICATPWQRDMDKRDNGAIWEVG